MAYSDRFLHSIKSADRNRLIIYNSGIVIALNDRPASETTAKEINGTTAKCWCCQARSSSQTQLAENSIKSISFILPEERNREKVNQAKKIQATESHGEKGEPQRLYCIFLWLSKLLWSSVAKKYPHFQTA
ncbi:hypothetical protein BH10BAC3_BH10BAC3_09850 [soil metagenome]